MCKLVFHNDFSLLPELLAEYKSVYMINDANVEEYADEIAGLIDLRGRMSIEATEDNKTMDTVLDIQRFLLALGADRNAFVLAVGGGVTTDVAGFAASIYKRGIKCAYVPTTLLSQVDAAIGGKTGINLDAYKNMVGTFCQPVFTYINPRTLDTLPQKELRSGAAEMLKTFIIEDNGHYEAAVKALSQGGDLSELVEAAARVKAGVVERDPVEKGERRKLNLGHTFAHGIEWYEHTTGVQSPLSHGEAVAIGIVQVAKMTSEELSRKIADDFKACGLPTELPYPVEALMPAMLKDKKNSDGKVKYVLVKSIGEVEQ